MTERAAGYVSERPTICRLPAPVAPLDRLNRLLTDLGESPLRAQDYLPVRAA